jgi:hypothetical protein
MPGPRNIPIHGGLMSLRTVTLLAGASLTLAGSAYAQSFSYADFSGVAGLGLNGTAVQNGSKLRLTEALQDQGGSAFSVTPISLGLNASFSTFFSFEILDRGGADAGDSGADGLTFTVQTNASTVGGIGGGLGYEGVPNSLAVEFDTYDNAEPGGSNHVGINTGGSITSLQSTMLLASPFDNGSPWYAWVDYNGAISSLEVRWSQTSARPAASMLTRTLDLPAALGSNSAYVGFTSATGDGWGEHNILSWTFQNSFNAGGAGQPASSVPEPGTYVLMAAGLAAMGAMARRRTGRQPA